MAFALLDLPPPKSRSASGVCRSAAGNAGAGGGYAWRVSACPPVHRCAGAGACPCVGAAGRLGACPSMRGRGRVRACPLSIDARAWARVHARARRVVSARVHRCAGVGACPRVSCAWSGLGRFALAAGKRSAGKLVPASRACAETLRGGGYTAAGTRRVGCAAGRVSGANPEITTLISPLQR